MRADPRPRKQAESGYRIFRYVVRQDRGGSPNPFNGWCSLAVCKPMIRRTARVGDWIIGLRSRVNDEVVYVMRVDEVMMLGEYWRDTRFRSKRPGHNTPPDNFYRPGPCGTFVQVENDLHGPRHALQDTSGRHALVSWHFWYFGDQSPQLPTDLVHLVHSGQGHALHINRRPNDVRVMTQWLAAVEKRNARSADRSVTRVVGMRASRKLRPKFLSACVRRPHSTSIGNFRYRTPLSSAGGNSPARMFTWIDGRIRVGIASVASRAVRMVTKSSSEMPS